MEHPSPRVAAYFTERRQRRGILVHPLGASYRALHNALSEGEAVALLADRGFGGGGSRVEFFGRLAVFPTGYLHLAAETGARILPMFARRVGSITEIRIEEPFKVERGEEDTGLAHMVELLELHIGAAPEQWARFTPVWNTRAGSPRVRRSEGE